MSFGQIFKQRIIEHEEALTEIFICKALGKEIPKEYNELKISSRHLNEAIKIIQKETKGTIVIPFDAGEIKTLHDIFLATGKVFRAFCNGEISSEMADNLHVKLKALRESLESSNINLIIEQLKLEHKKVLRMKHVGANATARFIPEVIDMVEDGVDDLYHPVADGFKEGFKEEFEDAHTG